VPGLSIFVAASDNNALGGIAPVNVPGLSIFVAASDCIKENFFHKLRSAP